jgi:hypothetical protein
LLAKLWGSTLWKSTLPDLSNGIKNTPMRGVLTPAIELWVFGSPRGLQVPTFGSVSFILTLNPKWGCDKLPIWFSTKKRSGIDPIYLAAKNVQHTVGKLSMKATTLLYTAPRSEVCSQSYRAPKSRVLIGDWENLQEFFLWAQVLATSLSSMPFPQHDPPIHKCFLHSLIIRRAKQYSWATHILAPFSLTPTSFDTTSTFIALHFNLDGYPPLFLEDYKLNQNLELSSISFKLAFQHMLHYRQVVLSTWFLNTFGSVFS